MSRHSPISGEECVKILCNKFGFSIVRRRGSHVVLRKDGVGTVVPMHRELRSGTLKGVLRLARVNEEEFWKTLK